MAKLTEEQRKALWAIAKTQPKEIFASQLHKIVGREYTNDQCRDALNKFGLLKKAYRNNAPRRYAEVHDYVKSLPPETKLYTIELVRKFKIAKDTAHQILTTHGRIQRSRRPKMPRGKRVVTIGTKSSIVVAETPTIDNRPEIYRIMDALRQKYQGGLRIADLVDEL